MFLLLTLAQATFVNRQIEQALDTFGAYTRQSCRITAENVGSEPIYAYDFLVPKERNSTLAFIQSEDAESTQLDILLSTEQFDNFVAYEIRFPEPIKPSEIADFGVLLSYSTSTKPLPEFATQHEKQFVYYEGLRNIPSKYKTDLQTLSLQLEADEIELLDNLPKPQNVGNDGLSKFELKEIDEFVEVPLKMRFENPVPQLRVEKLNRFVFVSHYGSTVSFDDQYDVHNVGTKLRGPFNRVEFMRGQQVSSLNAAAIRALRLPLPESHREEYFVDLVGNVSTSQVSQHAIDVVPRYPVMGGWFYNFTMGFALDLKDVVHQTRPGHYIMELPLVSGPELATYGRVTTTVVLPEGASNWEVISPRAMSDYKEFITYSYLDLFGRPALEISFDNVVFEMVEFPFFVSYEYSLATALRKPLAYTLLLFGGMVSAKFLLRK